MPLLYSYRGYGLSEGTPTEAGLMQDGQAAFEYLTKTRDDIDNSKVEPLAEGWGRSPRLEAFGEINIVPFKMQCAQLHSPLTSDPEQIAVFGKSLGGAVAIHVAAANANTVAAVIVENTFLSILDIAAKVQ